jgi:hypothetical protein
VHTLTSTPEINKSEEERKLQWNRTEQKNRTKKVKKCLIKLTIKKVTDRSRGKKEKETLSLSTAVSPRTTTGTLSRPELSSSPELWPPHRTSLCRRQIFSHSHA